MKNLTQVPHLLSIAIIFTFSTLFSCQENDSTDPDRNPLEEDDTVRSEGENSDLLLSLQFDNAILKEGNPPDGGMLADLKMDREIIQLGAGIKNRIRMLLPENFNEDVCGVFVKIKDSENYLDVNAIETNPDSLVIIYMGFDPGDLQLPLDFHLEIIPYNCLGVPLDKFERKVKVGSSENCTPHSPVAKWNWVSTTIDGELAYAPGFTIQVSTGNTNGCCLEGQSVDCIANGLPESVWKNLEYTSFVEYSSEYIVFMQDGSFNGGMWENKQNLDYSESDFCNFAPAYTTSLKENLYWGEYIFNSSNNQIEFTTIDARETEIYLDALDLIVIEYDRCWLRTDADYEIIDCNFLIERSSLEGQARERLFERFSGGWEWFD